MTRQNDNERLLKEVLAESDDGFHEALLGETLRLVQRRKRVRMLQRAGGALAVVAIIVAGVWRIPPAPDVRPPIGLVRSYQLTVSQSLPASQIITSHPLTESQQVVSVATVSIVHTIDKLGTYREVDDDELLALAPQPAALVRRGPHEAELLFLRPPDPDESQQN